MGQNHERQLVFDIWDWTMPCQQLFLFQQWSEDLKRVGFNLEFRQSPSLPDCTSGSI